MRLGSWSPLGDARSVPLLGFARAAAVCAAGLLCAGPAVWGEEPPPDEPPVTEAAPPEEPPVAEATPQGGAAEALPEEDYSRQFDIGFDAVVLRPMGFLQLVLGSAMLIPAYPLSYPGGGQQEVLDVLLWSPYDYTIRRPLGEF